jgi:DNA-binding MarR family transcriptional regulator
MQAILENKERIDTLIHRQHHRLAQKHGLSLEQFHLMIELDELMMDIPDSETGLPVGELAGHTGNAQNTISERITRLEMKNLVTRVRDTADRRINRVILTDDGRNLIAVIGREASSDLLKEALADLSDDEIHSLAGLLGKILKNLEKKVNESNGS